ncbi:MAG: hypothetical protein C4292_02325 [Nitrososphaera sp.]
MAQEFDEGGFEGAVQALGRLRALIKEIQEEIEASRRLWFREREGLSDGLRVELERVLGQMSGREELAQKLAYRIRVSGKCEIDGKPRELDRWRLDGAMQLVRSLVYEWLEGQE